MSTKICPRCGDGLAEHTFGQVRFDGCQGCGGIWFDHDELCGLAHDRESGLMAPEREFNPGMEGARTGGAMNCPNCQVHLYTFSYPHTPEVSLDACPQCKGVWVDDGELKQMAERMSAVCGTREPEVNTNPTRRLQARLAASFLISAPCPQCQLTNPAAATYCYACGTPIKTRSVVSFCPRCDTGLQEYHVGHCDTRLDACITCKGVWFASGELSVLIRIGLVEIQNLRMHIGDGLGHYVERIIHENHVVHCPKCHRGMVEEPLGSSQTMIDRCDYCNGVWMDAGELVNAFQMYSLGQVASRRLSVDPWSANSN